MVTLDVQDEVSCTSSGEISPFDGLHPTQGPGMRVRRTGHTYSSLNGTMNQLGFIYAHSYLLVDHCLYNIISVDLTRDRN